MKYSNGVLGLIVFVMMILMPVLAVTPQGQESEPHDNQQSTPSTPQNQDEQFQVLRSKTGKTEHYAAADYVFGVVAAEMASDSPAEALKAQAVAAYTIACRRREERKKNPPATLKGADLTDDHTVDQSFLTREEAADKWGTSAQANKEKIDAVVTDVLGQCVLYNGAYANTVYHAISGGKTEDASVIWGAGQPYLVPVESVGDLLAKGYLSTVTFSAEEFAKQAQSLDIKLSGDAKEWLGAIQTTQSGTVTAIALKGQKTTGVKMRSAFGLRSSNFDLNYEDGRFTFTVRGYGHGVGMSQNGARIMAEQGSDYEEILRWYYPGCVVGKIHPSPTSG